MRGFIGRSVIAGMVLAVAGCTSHAAPRPAPTHSASAGSASANQAVCNDYSVVARYWNAGDVQDWERATITMGRTNAASDTASILDNAVRQYETDASTLTGTPEPPDSYFAAVADDGTAIADVCATLGY